MTLLHLLWNAADIKSFLSNLDRNQLWPEVSSLRQVVERNKIGAVLFVEYFGFEIRGFSEILKFLRQKVYL